MLCVSGKVDYPLLNLGRSLSSDNDASLTHECLMIPHPELGWVPGLFKGVKEYTTECVKHSSLLFDIIGTIFQSLDNNLIHYDQPSCVSFNSSSLQYKSFEINSFILDTIHAVFPYLLKFKNITHLYRSLPLTPDIINPLSSCAISPLLLNNLVEYDLISSPLGFGLGRIHTLTEQRRYTLEASLCHILRERLLLNQPNIFLGNKLLIYCNLNHFIDQKNLNEGTILCKQKTNFNDLYLSCFGAYIKDEFIQQQAMLATNLFTSNQLIDQTLDMSYPHMTTLLMNVFRRMIVEQQNQLVFFSGITGSGKTMCFKQTLYFVLLINQFVQERNNESEKKGIIYFQTFENILTSALIILDAFGTISISTARTRNATRLFTSASCIYSQNSNQTLTLQNISFSVPCILPEAISSSNVKECYKILMYLSDRYRVYYKKEIDQLEKAFLTLNISQQEISYMTNIIAAILALRYPDTAPSFDTSSFDETVEAEQTEMLRASLLSSTSVSSTNYVRSTTELFQQEIHAIDVCAEYLGINATKLSASLYTPDIPYEISDLSPAPLTPAAEERRIARQSIARYLYHQLCAWIITRVNEAFNLINDQTNGDPTVIMQETKKSAELIVTFVDVPGFNINVDCTPGFDAFVINTIQQWIQQQTTDIRNIQTFMTDLHTTTENNKNSIDFNTPLDHIFGLNGVLSSFQANSKMKQNSGVNTLNSSKIWNHFDSVPHDTIFKTLYSLGQSQHHLLHLSSQPNPSDLCSQLGHRSIDEDQYWVNHQMIGPPKETVHLLKKCDNPILSLECKMDPVTNIFASSISSLNCHDDLATSSIDFLENEHIRSIGPVVQSWLKEMKELMKQAIVSSILCIRTQQYQGGCGDCSIWNGPFVLDQLRYFHTYDLYDYLCYGSYIYVEFATFLERYALWDTAPLFYGEKSLILTATCDFSDVNNKKNDTTSAEKEHVKRLIRCIQLQYRFNFQQFNFGKTYLYAKKKYWDELDDLFQTIRTITTSYVEVETDINTISKNNPDLLTDRTNETTIKSYNSVDPFNKDMTDSSYIHHDINNFGKSGRNQLTSLWRQTSETSTIKDMLSSVENQHLPLEALYDKTFICTTSQSDMFSEKDKVVTFSKQSVEALSIDKQDDSDVKQLNRKRVDDSEAMNLRCSDNTENKNGITDLSSLKSIQNKTSDDISNTCLSHHKESLINHELLQQLNYHALEFHSEEKNKQLKQHQSIFAMKHNSVDPLKQTNQLSSFLSECSLITSSFNSSLYESESFDMGVIKLRDMKLIPTLHNKKISCKDTSNNLHYFESTYHSNIIENCRHNSHIHMINNTNNKHINNQSYMHNQQDYNETNTFPEKTTKNALHPKSIIPLLESYDSAHFENYNTNHDHWNINLNKNDNSSIASESSFFSRKAKSGLHKLKSTVTNFLEGDRLRLLQSLSDLETKL